MDILDNVRNFLFSIDSHPELDDHFWLTYDEESVPKNRSPTNIVINKFINFGYGFFSTPGSLSGLMIMKRFERVSQKQLYAHDEKSKINNPFKRYLNGTHSFVIVTQNSDNCEELLERGKKLALIQQEIFRKLPKVVITQSPHYDVSLYPDYQSVYSDDPEIINVLSSPLFKEAMKGIFQEFFFDSHGWHLKINVFIDFETNPPSLVWNDFEKALYEAACKGYGDFVLVSRDEQEVTVDSLRLRITMLFFNGLLSGQFLDSGSKRYQTELSGTALNVLHQLLYNQLGSLHGSDRHTNQVSDYLDVLAFLHQHMCINDRILYITTNYLVHNFHHWPNFTEVYQLIFDDPQLFPPEVSGYTNWLSRMKKNLDQLGSYVQRSSE
jgi:hypothetical protein